MPGYAQSRVDLIEFSDKLEHSLPLAIDDVSLAFHLGIRNKTLWWLIRSNKDLYEEFRLRKNGGGSRLIHNPMPRLKNVQKVILARILDHVPIGKHVGAYVPGRSCLDTANQHVKKGVIISLDIKNFFTSVKRAMVRRVLHSYGYNHYVSSLLAALVCYTNFVPQGSPTSGYVANLVADQRFDQAIIKDLGTEWTYTRYSDDIDISHDDMQPRERITEVIEHVARHVGNAGFRLNQNKTKLEPYWHQQRILGIVVNEKTNIPRLEYNRLRCLIHNCWVHGFESQYKRAGQPTAPLLKSHIRGKLSYLHQIDPVKIDRLTEKFDLACVVHEK